jgi:major membrane immunogen (membrane-anchored lipoprotein)
MMKKKLLIFIICISVLLSACGQKNPGIVLAVGEEKGKEAGLALINQAFGTNATVASVEYQTRTVATFHDGTTGEMVSLEPGRVYVVKTAPSKGDNDSYYAEVDAVTGIAFRAERYLSGIVLTEEQQKQADALGTLDDFHPDDFLATQEEALTNINDLIRKRLEPNLPLMRVYPDMIETDSVDFPKVLLEYFVLMENGKVYNLTLCWPTMELVKVYIRN